MTNMLKRLDTLLTIYYPLRRNDATDAMRIEGDIAQSDAFKQALIDLYMNNLYDLIMNGESVIDYLHTKLSTNQEFVFFVMKLYSADILNEVLEWFRPSNRPYDVVFYLHFGRTLLYINELITSERNCNECCNGDGDIHSVVAEYSCRVELIFNKAKLDFFNKSAYYDHELAMEVSEIFLGDDDSTQTGAVC